VALRNKRRKRSRVRQRVSPDDSQFPDEGWYAVAAVDLRRQDGPDYNPGICEKCGKNNLRYVHTLWHRELRSTVNVGSTCAENMTKDYDAKERERELANSFARRNRWPVLQWRRSRKGNPCLRIHGCVVTIYPDKSRADKWRFSICDDDRVSFSDLCYDSELEAKYAAFNAFEVMLERA